MTTDTRASVSTHVLDTSTGRPAADVAVSLSARTGPDTGWTVLGGSHTDADGRCRDLPDPPDTGWQLRLQFDTGGYFQRDSSEGRSPDDRAFFPEVAITFALRPGEHHHVPLLLSPFGYSVYRGS